MAEADPAAALATALTTAGSLNTAKRPYKKRDRHDRPAGDKVAPVLHDSPAYCTLLELHQRMDDLISIRRNALREALHRPEHSKCRLRITLTHMINTLEDKHAGGSSSISKTGSGSSSSGDHSSVAWTLLVHGRTLDGDGAQGTAQAAAAPAGVLPPGIIPGSQAAGLLGAAVLPAPGTHTTIKHPLTAYLRRVEITMYAADPPAPPPAPAAPAADNNTADGAGGGGGGGGWTSTATPPAPMDVDPPAAAPADAPATGAAPAPGSAAAPPAPTTTTATTAPAGIAAGTTPSTAPGAAAGGGGGGAGGSSGGAAGGGASEAAVLRRVVWDRAEHSGPHKESLEFKSIGLPPDGLKVSVVLVFDQQPAKYLLPPALAGSLNVAAETKPRIQQLVLHYVRQHRLMDLEQNVRLPDSWAELLGASELPLPKVLEGVVRSLQPCQPITMEHIIRPPGYTPTIPASSDSTAGGATPAPVPVPPAPAEKLPPAQVLDVDCDALAPFNPNVEKQANLLLESHNPDKELVPLDAELSSALARLAEHRRRRAMLLGIAQSPVDYMNGLVATQARELRITKHGQYPVPIIAGQAQAQAATNLGLAAQPLHVSTANLAANVAKEFEGMRRTDVFKGKWVEDAVITYLTKRQTLTPQQQALHAAAAANLARLQQLPGLPQFQTF